MNETVLPCPTPPFGCLDRFLPVIEILKKNINLSSKKSSLLGVKTASFGQDCRMGDDFLYRIYG
jgi:hypothetical protein